jgi:cytoskeletal protein RodZ
MSETIGQQLKQARLARNLSLEKVVQATRIRAHYLAALEADDFESIPSAAQTRGFLKLYADFLGLSLEDMFARQRGAPAPDLEPAAPQEPPSPAENAAEPQPPAAESPKSKPRKPRQRKKDSVSSSEAETQTEPSAAPEPDERPAKEETTPPENRPTQADLDSQIIFKAIGDSLRLRRESLGLNLDEIERHTHVRKHYLESLESGQFDHLPSSVQTRGMLNNYAHFLDMDVDSLLLKFADGLQAQLVERQPKPGIAPETRSKASFKFALPVSLRRILSPDLLVGGGVLILLVVFAIWGTGRIIRLNAAATPQPTAPSISDILLASPIAGEAAFTSTTGPGSETVTLEAGATLEITLPPAGEGPVQVILVATRSTWAKVIVDGKVEFEGRVTSGTAYPYDGNNQIEVLTGDGSAISIIYNQSNLGPMGAFGEVVDRIYTATNILIPTVTFTPTPTVTQTPTITPRPSATPRPSNTPRPSATPKP